MTSLTGSQTRPASQLPLLDVLSPLWTRWRLLALVFALTLGATWALIPHVQQKYKSEAVLILDRASNDIATFDTPLTSLVIDSEAIASEIEILFSGELAARVVESEGLLETDEFNPDGESADKAMQGAVHTFLQQLEVQRKGISRAIVVKFESTDAERAARVVNAIVARYLEHELERKIEQESIASLRLSEEIDVLESRIAESEVRIAEFRQRVGQSGAGDESQREKNIAGLNAQRVLAQAESMDAEALLKQARSLADNPAAFATLPSNSISPALQGLRSNELELQTKLEQLRITYGEQHPQVQQVRKQLNRTRLDIRSEIDKSLQVLEGTTESARLRVSALTAEMQTLEKAESGTWSGRAQLLALERERASDIDRLEFYSSRLRELSQSSSIENLKPFARIISSGQVSDSAEFPSQRSLLLLVPTLATLACLGLLVVSGLFRRFTLRSLPALPADTSWFGRIPPASLFSRLPLIRHVVKDRPRTKAVAALCESIDTALASEGRVVMLTGLAHGVGVSTLATAVAKSYAESGHSVLLINLDLRKPKAKNDARTLNANALPGRNLTQALLNQVLQLDERTGLYRLSVQFHADTDSELLAVEASRDLAIEKMLSSAALGQLLHDMSARFSRLVLDLPPVLDAPDSTIVARLADVSLIVTTPASLSTRIDDLYRGTARLKTGNDILLGIVLNRMDDDLSDTGSLDYVASDHHHASVTQAMPARIGAASTPLQVARMQESDQDDGSSQSAAAVTVSPSRLRGESWLLRQSPRKYTLCLMTTPTRPDGGKSYLGDAAELPLACYLRRTVEGNAEYVLLMGLFDTRQEAWDMIDRLVADPLQRTTRVISLSAVNRDILHFRSVLPAHERAQRDKDVA